MILKFKSKQTAPVVPKQELAKEQSSPTRGKLAFINSAHVKQLALDVSKKHKAGKFNRVSRDFLVRVNNHVRAFVENEIRSAPSVGKTIY